jgi:hypothetical protein
VEEEREDKKNKQEEELKEECRQALSKQITSFQMTHARTGFLAVPFPGTIRCTP